MKRSRCKAFSLIEIMVVLVIVSILGAVSGPAIMSIMKGNNVTQAGILIEQTLTRARQLALTQNRTVQVRLYSYADSSVPGSQEEFRVMQLYQREDDGSEVPVGKVIEIPDGAIINTSSTLSPLIGDTLDVDPDFKLPVVGTTYTSKAVTFYADGSTNLDKTQVWFLTIHNQETESNASAAPDNFYTIQLDPLLGTIRNHRP